MAAEVVVSNNNINASTGETRHRVVEHGRPRQQTTRSSIKLWLLRVRTGEREAKLRRSEVERSGQEIPLVGESEGGNCHHLGPKYPFTRQAIRSNYMDKSIEAKKKVIRMLFVVVAEFFVCWAPLHVLNTWYLFSPDLVYQYVGSTGVSLVQLLAYISSCCNPITYCFMNRKFRQAFLGLFNCPRVCWERGGGRRGADAAGGTLGPNNSELSANDSTLYVGRACRSGTLILSLLSPLPPV